MHVSRSIVSSGKVMSKYFIRIFFSKGAFFFFLFIPLLMLAQKQQTIDSLYYEYKATNEDTTKVELLFKIGKEKMRQQNIQQEELIAVYKEALLIAKKSKYKPAIAKAHNWLSRVYDSFKNDSLFHIHASEALEIYTRLKDEKNLCNMYLAIGNAYMFKSKYELATENFLKLLKVAEAISDSSNIAKAYNSIGNLNTEMKDYKNALSNYKKSLRIREALKDEQAVSHSYINIGNCYNYTEQPDSAIFYYTKALKLQHKLGNTHGPAWSYDNIGIAYQQKGDYERALEYHLLAKEIIDKYNIVSVKPGNDLNLGKTYFKLGNAYNALLFTDKAIEALKASGNIRFLITAYESKYQILEFQKRYAESLEYLKLLNHLKDSLFNVESVTHINNLQTAYIQEKMNREKELLELAEQEAHKNEIQKQRYLLYLVILLAIILSLIAIIIWAGYKRKIKHNAFITEQKNIVEQKNKEITDSINYAKRIQQAILPSRYSLTENLKNGFVIYKPKDIVAGDFYWLERKNDCIFFAAADCTGHGVPGALVSVVCSNALSKSVLEENISDPGKILDRTRELVIERFSKSEEDVKDGMDISLCAYYPSTQTLRWAGANNPLWLIRNGELKETMPNKQPIGKAEYAKPFTTHTIEIEKGDTFYLFTDGYQDQFGGPKGKKFKSTQLMKLLLSIKELNMPEQEAFLNKEFETWRGNLEQVDDVCMIGLRV